MRTRHAAIILSLALAAGSATAWVGPVTLYHSYHPSTARDDVFELRQTELVLIQPELKTFADEHSAEAMDFSTTMDDWSYYASETTRRFAALQVQVVSTDKRYLVFTLAKDQRMIFDSRTPQPNSAEEVFWGAFLYRKGQPPIAIDITDNDMAAAKAYLGLK